MSEQMGEYIRTGLHGAGWYARADLSPDDVDGIVSDVLDLLADRTDAADLTREAGK